MPAKQITLNMALAVDSISFDAVRVALNLVANMQRLEMTARFFIQRLEQSGISEQRRRTVSKIDYQALREAAQNAKDLGGIKNYKRGEQAVAEFESLITPHIVLALLDERERNQQYIKRRDQENEEIALTVGKLRVELEAAEKRIAELEAREVVLPRAHDVHPLGPQSAKIFCEFHRSIVNRCADEIRKVGVKVSIKGN